MFSFFHCLPSIFFLLYHILFCLSNRVWGQQFIGDLTAAENFACEKNVIQKKYDKLCEEFEELQENYNDLFDDYYEV